MEFRVIGSFEWSFDSGRHFGAKPDEIKMTGIATAWKRESEGDLNVQSAAIAGPAMQVV
jgi:hypothetical protein